MAKIVISRSYGAGFYFTNETVYNWLKEHGAGGLINIRHSDWITPWYNFNCYRDNETLVECIEELGRDETGYDVFEYDETLYEYQINDYDGMEWVELIPILDVELMTEMSAEDLAAYLDEKGIKHNYGRNYL